MYGRFEEHLAWPFVCHFQFGSDLTCEIHVKMTPDGKQKNNNNPQAVFKMSCGLSKMTWLCAPIYTDKIHFLMRRTSNTKMNRYSRPQFKNGIYCFLSVWFRASFCFCCFYTYRIIMVEYVLNRIISTVYTSKWLDGLAALLFSSPVYW